MNSNLCETALKQQNSDINKCFTVIIILLYLYSNFQYGTRSRVACFRSSGNATVGIDEMSPQNLREGLIHLFIIILVYSTIQSTGLFKNRLTAHNRTTYLKYTINM